MRKFVIIVLIILFFYLQYQLWCGCIKSFYLKKAFNKRKVITDKTHKRNQLIAKRVRALQLHQISIEDLAREQLGMIKKGEVYYQIVDRHASKRKK